MRALHISTPGPRYVLLRGPGLRDWLTSHDVPAVRAPIDGGYKLHVDRLPDVLAMAAEDRVSIRMRGEVA